MARTAAILPPAPQAGFWRSFARSFGREVGYLRTSRWDLALNTLLPLICVAMMAWLFSGGTPRDLPVVVVDQDHSAFSREAVRMLDAAPGIAVTAVVGDTASAWPRVRRDGAIGVFVVPPRAERDIVRGRSATLVLFSASSYYTAAATVQREGASVATALGVRFAKADTAKLAPARVRPAPVSVQTTTLFNPNTSYEWMLVGPLQAALLVILISCAAITAVGREFARKTVLDWLGPGAHLFGALSGKLAPYVLTYLVYGLGCVVCLAWGGGYPVVGSVLVLAGGYGVMLVAYALLAAAIVSVNRDSVMAMGSAAVYASSAMAFSGAFFPMRGAGLFAQSWNAVQPYTWFAQISMQVWQMGAPVAVSAKALFILGVMVVVTGVGAWAGLALARKDAQRGTL